MLYDKRQRCQRWQNWIVGFAQRQRAERRWIALPEIADWCARSVTGASAVAEEEARELAYRRLDQWARVGEFERHVFRGGRAITLSEVRYLDPELPRFRPGREQLAHVGSIRDLAQSCWLPRELARQWFAAHGYPRPAHFDPVAQMSPVASRPNAPAPDPEIHKAITAAYDDANQRGMKPPNLKEIIAPVWERLRAEGLRASGQQIQKLAEDPRHAGRRPPPGRTVSGEKRQQRD